MDRNIYALRYAEDKLSPNECLNVLSFWKSYPNMFTRYAWFTSQRMQKASSLYLVTGRDESERLYPLRYSLSGSVDQEVKLMHDSEPSKLGQFHAECDYAPKKGGWSYLTFREGENGEQGVVIGEFKKAENGSRIEINRFQLPGIHRDFEKILIRELELRGVNSGSFIKSGTHCRESAYHQDCWTVNYGVWSNCLNYQRYARVFPQAIPQILDAEDSCTQLQAKLEAEKLKSTPVISGGMVHENPKAIEGKSPAQPTIAKRFSVSELCEICSVKNDTLKKYGEPAINWWLGRGQSGKQFSVAEAIKIVEAVEAFSPEMSVKKHCEKWLNEIRTKSDYPK